jgi:UDP-N-acetylmuramoyl-tripeptide--D-alanyl-D-alanine ligase
VIKVTRLSEIASVISAESVGADAAFDDVTTDTRTLLPGQLYIALSGKNFDGNAFIKQAQEKGACGAVVSKPANVGLPQLVVTDTARALGALAKWNRQQSHATVIAITGSQGKTTVKEMAGSILQTKHQVLVTRGNLNNEIGAPLTLLQLKKGHEYAVIELGASAAGEIAYTVGLAQPQVVLINNAAAAHLEGFGSLAGVVSAKGEIIDGVAEDGVVVLNADDENLSDWIKRAASRKTQTFSVHGAVSGADCFAEEIQIQDTRSSFRLHTSQGNVLINLPLPGRHNIANALAAATITLAAGAELIDVKNGLAAVKPVAGRLRTLAGVNGSRLIDDSYNASPGSFKAAVDVLAACSGERVLIVGDMAELGSESATAHRQLGEYALSRSIDQLWATGRESELAARAFGANARHFSDQSSLIKHAQSCMDAATTVLVKGSRSSRMDIIVAQLSNGAPE